MEKTEWHVSTEGKQTEATRLKYTTTAKQNISRERIQFSSTYIHTPSTTTATTAKSKQKNYKQTTQKHARRSLEH